jgi:hypothetical protein
MAFQAKPRANFYSPLFGVSFVLVFSILRNPLLAESLYLTQHIERMGTGTGGMIRLFLAPARGFRAKQEGGNAEVRRARR